MTTTTDLPPTEEQVVLLDEQGHAIGRTPKRSVHHQATPLHLAFSCYVFDGRGSFLLTRRALGKATWPGVWTNSVCGHPAPDEAMTDAVVRRARDELGVVLHDVRLVLPAFRYQAEMPDGVRENEMCPVFVATTTDSVRAAPEEVEDWEWVPWAEFSDAVAGGAREVSPWCREQVELLREHERAHGGMVAADPAGLPPAARHR